MAPASRPGNRSSLINVRPMPMIHEDEDATPAPALPAKSHRRSVTNGDTRLSPYGYGPPPYSDGGDESLPDRKTEPQQEGIKNNEWFTKRGGWCRLGLMAFIFIAITVGLGVGLSIGLHKTYNHHQSHDLSETNVEAALHPIATLQSPNPAFSRWGPTPSTQP
jgi:hypothetical protein